MKVTQKYTLLRNYLKKVVAYKQNPETVDQMLLLLAMGITLNHQGHGWMKKQLFFSNLTIWHRKKTFLNISILRMKPTLNSGCLKS